MEKITGLFIATPVHGDTVYVPYMKSIIELTMLLKKEKIPYTYWTVSGDSLVPRARNMCVASFIKSGFSHMIFIDSDISFRPNDVLRMIQTNHEVVGSFYPKKKLCYDSIAQKAKGGTGHPYEYVMTIDKTKHSVINGCIEVLEIGTGFLMIQRSAIDKMIAKYPHMKYKTQYITEEQNKDDFYAFFQTHLDPETGIYYSEDYYMCKLWRALGEKVYGFIDCNLTHTGSLFYQGDLRAVITIKSDEPEKPVAKQVENPAVVKPIVKMSDPLFMFG